MKEIIEKIKIIIAKIPFIIINAILAILLKIKTIVLKTLLNPLVAVLLGLAGGFFVGARLHEVGMLEGNFGKDLSSSTVYITGSCKVNGIPRIPALAEDQLIVTGQNEKNELIGILRKTRELVVCDKESSFTISKLSPWKKLGEELISVPELQLPKNEIKEPEWKKLAQKTLIMSGNCVGVDGKAIPPFTDEKVDVTNVEAAKDNPNIFMITGIKKSDKFSIACASSAVKYSIFVESDKEVKPEISVKKEIKSFVGDTLLVTGTCFPDSRLPKHKATKNVAFYPLINNPIQIIEEKLDTEGKIKWLSGFSMKHGVQIVCDHEKFAITYKQYDSENTKLEGLKPSEQGIEAESGSNIKVKTEEGQN